MADTIPIVRWALEMRCGLRAGENALLPQEAAETLSLARAISRALSEKKESANVVGDVFVSGCTQVIAPGNEARRRWREYPKSGHVVSDAFKSVEGGLEGVWKMCGGCVANITAGSLAGCEGFITQWAGSSDLEHRLVEIISRMELSREMAAAFPQTKPIWYGLWARSPIPKQSLPVLRTLMTGLLQGVGNRDRDEFKLFIQAIDWSLSRNLNLHVKLGRPGHTDFGLLTIFPHCPFCKAEANVERWKRKYPTELQTCEVCGTKFSPAETAMTKRDHYDRDDLRKTLGPERFAQFAMEYLVANGATRSEAEAIAVQTERAHSERMEKLRLRWERAKREKKFVSEVVLVNLPRVPAPPADFVDDEEAGDTKPDATEWFDGDTMAEAIRRCLQMDIQVGELVHKSTDEDLARYEAQKVISNPLQLLAKWRSEGCNEKFYATFRVPEGMNLPRAAAN
jgi:hypothetical protein